MKKETLQKILGDPQFDPYTVLEQALVDFIQSNPEEVAKDEVCLKHLVKDSECISEVSGIIDMNDAKLLGDLLASIRRSTSWNASSTLDKVLNRLKEVDAANVSATFEAIKEAAPATQLTKMHPDFLDALQQEQVDEFVKEAVGTDAAERWEADDWKIAFRSDEGTKAYFAALVDGKVRFQRDTFSLISHCATVVKGDPEAEQALLTILDDKFAGYVCFKCGRGSKLDSYGHEAPNNVIKSLSGYTLHRNQCDGEGEFLSPHEIFTGDPKVLSFPCGNCGETFTTLSGCTLHEKSCK
jgi:hypothetical protein